MNRPLIKFYIPGQPEQPKQPKVISKTSSIYIPASLKNKRKRNQRKQQLKIQDSPHELQHKLFYYAAEHPCAKMIKQSLTSHHIELEFFDIRRKVPK